VSLARKTGLAAAKANEKDDDWCEVVDDVLKHADSFSFEAQILTVGVWCDIRDRRLVSPREALIIKGFAAQFASRHT
jgi:hypothetical protein